MLWNPFSDPPLEMQGAVVAVGNFDGVHRGHCRLLATLRHRARSLQVPGIVVSFEPHPLQILNPATAPIPLTWPERKCELLTAAGADGVLLCKVTPEFLDLSATDFLEHILLERLKIRGVVEGRNFGFGKDRAGDVEMLAEFCRERQISLDVVPLAGKGKPNSSTLSRALLAEGSVAEAAERLGRPHRIRGEVVSGDRRGGPLGFPTANLAKIPVLVPGEGVYAVRAAIEGRTEWYAGACHVGPNPTFDQGTHKVEVHLLDFSGDLYGKTIEVDFLQRLRPTQRFENIQALQHQLRIDVAQAREIARSRSAESRYSGLHETIRQWIHSQLADEGMQVASLKLDDAGQLELHWNIAEPALPTDQLSLLLRLEEPLRRTFPEVQSVRSLAPRPLRRAE